MISIAVSLPRRPLILARFLAQLTGLMLAGLVLLGTFSPSEAKPQFSAIAVDARTGKFCLAVMLMVCAIRHLSPRS